MTNPTLRTKTSGGWFRPRQPFPGIVTTTCAALRRNIRWLSRSVAGHPRTPVRGLQAQCAPGEDRLGGLSLSHPRATGVKGPPHSLCPPVLTQYHMASPHHESHKRSRWLGADKAASAQGIQGGDPDVSFQRSCGSACFSPAAGRLGGGPPCLTLL